MSSSVPTSAIDASFSDASFSDASSHDGSSHGGSSLPGGSSHGGCNDVGTRLFATEDAAILSEDAADLTEEDILELIRLLIKEWISTYPSLQIKIVSNLPSLPSVIDIGGISKNYTWATLWYDEEELPPGLFFMKSRPSKIRIVSVEMLVFLYEYLKEYDNVLYLSCTTPSLSEPGRKYWICYILFNNIYYKIIIERDASTPYIYSDKLRDQCGYTYALIAYAIVFNNVASAYILLAKITPCELRITCIQINNLEESLSTPCVFGGSSSFLSQATFDREPKSGTVVKQVSAPEDLKLKIIQALEIDQPFYIENYEIKYDIAILPSANIIFKAATFNPPHKGHNIMAPTTPNIMKILVVTQGHVFPDKIQAPDVFTDRVFKAVEFMSPNYIFLILPTRVGYKYIDMLKCLKQYNSKISLELAVDSLIYISSEDMHQILSLIEYIYVCDRTYGGISKHLDRFAFASAYEITDDTIISLDILIAMEIIAEDPKLVRVVPPPEISKLSSSAIRARDASHTIATQSSTLSSSAPTDSTATDKPP